MTRPYACQVPTSSGDGRPGALVVEGDGLESVLLRGRHRAVDLVLVHGRRRPVVGRGAARLSEEALDAPGREADEDAARGLRGVAEVVDRAPWHEGESARAEGVQLVADPDLEASVDNVE